MEEKNLFKVFYKLYAFNRKWKLEQQKQTWLNFRAKRRKLIKKDTIFDTKELLKMEIWTFFSVYSTQSNVMRKYNVHCKRCRSNLLSNLIQHWISLFLICICSTELHNLKNPIIIYWFVFGCWNICYLFIKRFFSAGHFRILQLSWYWI